MLVDGASALPGFCSCNDCSRVTLYSVLSVFSRSGLSQMLSQRQHDSIFVLVCCNIGLQARSRLVYLSMFVRSELSVRIDIAQGRAQNAVYYASFNLSATVWNFPFIQRILS